MYYINLYEIFLLASNIYIFTSCVKLNCRQLIGSDNCDANMKWGPLLCWWNTFYCTVRKTMLSYCSVVVILMMAVGYSDGGCHVNDWWVFFGRSLIILYMPNYAMRLTSTTECKNMLYCVRMQSNWCYL